MRSAILLFALAGLAAASAANAAPRERFGEETRRENRLIDMTAPDSAASAKSCKAQGMHYDGRRCVAPK